MRLAFFLASFVLAAALVGDDSDRPGDELTRYQPPIAFLFYSVTHNQLLEGWWHMWPTAKITGTTGHDILQVSMLADDLRIIGRTERGILQVSMIADNV